MNRIVLKSIKVGGLLLLVSVVAAGCIKRSTDDSVNVPEHVQRQQIVTPPTTATTPPPPLVKTPAPQATVPTPAKSQSISYKGVDGKNALELLRASHTITTKSYSGLGEFVESIDGVKPDSKHFWSFYINGKSSNVGASSYTTKTGENIEWKLEAIN